MVRKGPFSVPHRAALCPQPGVMWPGIKAESQWSPTARVRRDDATVLHLR